MTRKPYKASIIHDEGWISVIFTCSDRDVYLHHADRTNEFGEVELLCINELAKHPSILETLYHIANENALWEVTDDSDTGDDPFTAAN